MAAAQRRRGKVLPFALLLLSATVASAQLDSSKFTFPSGERLEFLGYPASTSLRLYTNATSRAYAALKLGALSELDAYGQPIAKHIISDLSKLKPEIETGRRVAGNTQYEYLTMTFQGEVLGDSLTRTACPSMDAVLARASQMGIVPQGSAAIAGIVPGAASLGRTSPEGSFSMESGLLPSDSGLSGAALAEMALQGGRRLAEAMAPTPMPKAVPVPADTKIAVSTPSKSVPAPAPKPIMPALPAPAAKPMAPAPPQGLGAAAFKAIASAFGGGGGVPVPTAPSKPTVPSTPAVPVASVPAKSLSPVPAVQVSKPKVTTPVPSTAADLAPKNVAPAAAPPPPTQLSSGPRAPVELAAPAAASALGASGEPSLRVTFMFGFTSNKTFPYGPGHNVSVPKGGVKFTLEASNWPFCSPHNTLKLELIAASSMQHDSQPQMLTTEEEQDSEEMAEDVGLGSSDDDGSTYAMLMSHSRRRLSQHNYGAEFFEPESAPVSKGSMRGELSPQLAALAGLAHGLPGGLAGLPPNIAAAAAAAAAMAAADPRAASGMGISAAGMGFNAAGLGASPAGFGAGGYGAGGFGAGGFGAGGFGAALLPRAPLRRLHSVRLLVGPGVAAALDVPGYSFYGTTWDGESEVGVAMASNTSDGAARLSLMFSNFPSSLYYDPTLYLTSPVDMELAGDNSGFPAMSAGIGVACDAVGEDGSCRGRRGRATNAARSMSTSSLLARFGSALLAVLLAAAALC